MPTKARELQSNPRHAQPYKAKSGISHSDVWEQAMALAATEKRVVVICTANRFDIYDSTTAPPA